MSHFVVMVIGDNPGNQLEPFDENIEVDEYERRIVSEEDKKEMLDYYKKHHYTFSSFDECYEHLGGKWDGNRCRKGEDGIWREYSTYNPKSKWDWYVLGGRWSGDYLRLKPDATSGIKGESGIGDNEPGYDAALKKDIDFDIIRKEARERGAKYYQEIVAKCGGTIPHLEIHWDTILNSPQYAHLDIEEKRKLYHDQEAVKIWDGLNIEIPFSGPSLEDFQCTVEEFAQRNVASSFIPYAFVMDSKWYGRGDMGWWAISTNEIPVEEWQKKVWDLVNALPDDTLISFFDCHI